MTAITNASLVRIPSMAQCVRLVATVGFNLLEILNWSACTRVYGIISLLPVKVIHLIYERNVFLSFLDETIFNFLV